MAITDANDAALRLYGYTRDEFLRLSALDIRPPEEHERLKSCLQQSNLGTTSRHLDASPQRWQHFPVEIGAFHFVHDGDCS